MGEILTLSEAHAERERILPWSFSFIWLVCIKSEHIQPVATFRAQQGWLIGEAQEAPVFLDLAAIASIQHGVAINAFISQQYLSCSTFLPQAESRQEADVYEQELLR